MLTPIPTRLQIHAWSSYTENEKPTDVYTGTHTDTEKNQSFDFNAARRPTAVRVTARRNCSEYRQRQQPHADAGNGNINHLTSTQREDQQRYT